MRKKVLTYIQIFLLCFSIIFSLNPTKLYADTMSKEDIKNNENANELWDYIVGNGGTEFWAAAAVANAYAEHGLSTSLETNKSGYWGAFQFAGGSSAVTSFKGWCSENSLDCNKISTQYKYLIDVYRDSCCSITGLSNTEIASDTEHINSCEAAAAYFALGMEGCVCFSGITYGSGSINDSFHKEDGTLCGTFDFPLSKYGTVSLQNLVGRTSNTEVVYESLSGKTVQHQDNTSTATTMTDIQAPGLISEEEFAVILQIAEKNWENQINSTSRDNLDVQELEDLSDWEIISNQDDTNLVVFLRKLVAVLGVLLILWGLLLYLAYWFDTINTLIPFQFVPMLSFGKLEVLNEEETTFSLAGDRDNTKRVTVNHKNILTICILLVAAGVFILTGFIYKIIGALYFKIQELY